VKVRARWVPLALVAMACALSSLALADTPPSRWDRARDPRVEDDWDLHLRVSPFLWPEQQSEDERRRKWEAAESWLEEAHAESSPDVRLRFDLGEVYEDLDHYVRAAEVLEPALAMAPDHPAAAQAWEALASAYAHLDRSADEVRAYDAFLARTLSVAPRATVLGNRAEAEMRLGHLDEAILGYRDAIALSESASGVLSLFISDVLARWGLAVALDRSGDETAGAKEATLATQFDSDLKIISNTKFVYFVPDYERFYYLGLATTVHAKLGAIDHARPNRSAVAGVSLVELWDKVIRNWTGYIAGAEVWNKKHRDRSDRWLSLARVHLAKALRERAAAEKSKR
jgi:hypothetical protein